MGDEIGEGEKDCIAEEGGGEVGMPFYRRERNGGYRFGNGVHGGGCPVEQEGEEFADGRAPEEGPPEDAGEHEKIDEGEEQEIGQQGEGGDVSEVVGNEWGGEEGANQRYGDDGDEPGVMHQVVME